MRTRRWVAIAFGVIVSAGVLYAGWQKHGPTSYQIAFQPGGTVDLDLSAGGYTIRGISENQVRVEIDPADLPYSHSEISVNGSIAKVSVSGPASNFNATIYIPQQSNLRVSQTLGELRVVNVDGNEDLGLNIGQIEIPVSDKSQLKSVSASVMIGSVSADAWGEGKGGFFRSFHAGGHGNYAVKAHLDIGDIQLGE